MVEAGKVFKEHEFIDDVTYQYSTTNEYHLGVGVAQESYLRIQPATAINPYIGETLTLLMRDGKKQDFIPSGDGECRCLGGLR
jgi:hypothetical protein